MSAGHAQPALVTGRSAGARQPRRNRPQGRNDRMFSPITTPGHALLPTVAALLDPAHLGRIAGRRIERIHHEPLASVDGLSEVPLERIVATGPSGTHSFVLKRLA